jgi:hypothetical protein
MLNIIKNNITQKVIITQNKNKCVFQISEWRKGKNRLKSKLEIDPAMPKDAGYYECQSGENKITIFLFFILMFL